VKATARRKVRIVKRRLPSRGAIISLAIAVGASATALFAWRVFRPVPPAVPYIRTLSDVLLTYECQQGHRFTAPGQVGPLACPICKAPAYPRMTFECPIHGKREVEVQFAISADGFEEVSQMRLPGGQWTSRGKGLRCPSCQSPLVRPKQDDLSNLGLRRPKTRPGERVAPKETSTPDDRRPAPKP